MDPEIFTSEGTYTEKMARKQKKWSFVAKLFSSITFICIPIIAVSSGVEEIAVAGISLLVLTAIYFQFIS
ncbi:MAG: hypothetical protein ACLFTR_05785 [Candidatus Woesearchaeota archaeon]